MDDYTTVEKQAKSGFQPTLGHAILIGLALLGGAVAGIVVWVLLFLCFGYPTQTDMTIVGVFQIPAQLRFGAMSYGQWFLECVGVVVLPLLFAVYFARTVWRSITKHRNPV